MTAPVYSILWWATPLSVSQDSNPSHSGRSTCGGLLLFSLDVCQERDHKRREHDDIRKREVHRHHPLNGACLYPPQIALYMINYTIFVFKLISSRPYFIESLIPTIMPGPGWTIPHPDPFFVTSTASRTRRCLFREPENNL